MRRNRVLMRRLLAYLTESERPWAPRPETPEGVEEDVLDYHLSLAEQAGWVIVRRKPGQAPQFQVTWQGHDFIEEERAS